jgi:ABC-type transport system substrate-binding protein
VSGWGKLWSHWRSALGWALACLVLCPPTQVHAQSPAASQTQARTLSPSPTAPVKTLRYAFRVAETGFDPAQINDLYSRTVTPHIFEGLYGYDHLARPAKIIPVTAVQMPETSEDFKVWTVRIRPGIHFADDPAFKGSRRELVAEDYVYALKRFADPRFKSPAWTYWQQFELLGLSGLRQQALDLKKPFDYDTPIAGVRALDRYTVRFEMARPRPRFIEALAGGDLFGAVAREVVEHYGDQIAAHPVGTGPFRLAQWRRSSLIVLERNPQYRDVRYDERATASATDVEGQAMLERFKGRRLPMLDRVEIAIIEEEQPRWLGFLNGGQDFLEILPAEYLGIAMPGGQLAPHLAKQGIRAYRVLRSEIQVTQFNMDDPVVGGYSLERVALRRAIGLGMNIPREIRLVWNGQAIPAQSTLMPGTTGYDPRFKSEAGDYDPLRARALLDVTGWLDRDGDGWRETPEGQPLVLDILTQPDNLSRQLNDLRKKDFDALGIRVKFRTQKWPENLKAARAGKYMIWRVGSSAAGLDGQSSLARFHGKQIGGQNMARFSRPAFDAIYESMEVMPDSPERLAKFDELKRMGVAWAAYKPMVHRYVSDLSHPWLMGYRRPAFWQEWWHMVDTDSEAAAAHR